MLIYKIALCMTLSEIQKISIPLITYTKNNKNNFRYILILRNCFVEFALLRRRPSLVVSYSMTLFMHTVEGGKFIFTDQWSTN